MLSTFPNLLLSPGAHFVLCYACQGMGDHKIANVEKQIAFLLISFIKETGDGTKENPYLVLRISDEHDVLSALGKKRGSQSLIIDQGRFLDLQTCTDGTEIYFDVTIPYCRNASSISNDNSSKTNVKLQKGIFGMGNLCIKTCRWLKAWFQDRIKRNDDYINKSNNNKLR